MITTFGKTPEPGELIEVAPAVYWLRMPLPMSLNHINLYLLESGPSLIPVFADQKPDHRQQITDTHLKGKPVERILARTCILITLGKPGFYPSTEPHWR